MISSKLVAVLVTGAAGFIGSHTARVLLARGYAVVGVDDFNDYYPVSLKEDRVRHLLNHPQFTLHRGDICDAAFLNSVFEQHSIHRIAHLAARAGVRYSLLHPDLYQQVNVGGTLNVLECARRFEVGQMVFASTSSVYGGNTKIPFSETDPVDTPISPYAATKRAAELLCYTYHHLYKFPVTVLRFFTVYGPWGRPDMALFKFTKAILEGEPIEVFNGGDMRRDFTYIDDIVSGVVEALERPLGFETINLGNSHSEALEDFIALLEKALGLKAQRKNLPMQPGDVPATYADISKAQRLLGFSPQTKIQDGIPRFVEWYKGYYK